MKRLDDAEGLFDLASRMEIAEPNHSHFFFIVLHSPTPSTETDPTSRHDPEQVEVDEISNGSTEPCEFCTYRLTAIELRKDLEFGSMQSHPCDTAMTLFEETSSRIQEISSTETF